MGRSIKVEVVSNRLFFDLEDVGDLKYKEYSLSTFCPSHALNLAMQCYHRLPRSQSAPLLHAVLPLIEIPCMNCWGKLRPRFMMLKSTRIPWTISALEVTLLTYADLRSTVTHCTGVEMIEG